jgi:GNAT superfamily N-acetyltransferase
MNWRIEYLADHPHVLQTLAAWHHAQWNYLNPQRTLAERIAKLQRHLQRGAIPTTFVALDGDALLGSASLVECDLSKRPDLTPWLAGVFVAPEHRNQGIGDALVARVEQEARDLGFAKLYLFTPDRTPFYARRGWKSFAQDDCHGQPITLMSLDL